MRYLFLVSNNNISNQKGNKMKNFLKVAFAISMLFAANAYGYYDGYTTESQVASNQPMIGETRVEYANERPYGAGVRRGRGVGRGVGRGAARRAAYHR